MKTPLFSVGGGSLLAVCGALLLLLTVPAAAPVRAQIPAAPSPTDRVFRATGTAGQPFSVQVIDLRRGLGNTVALRLTLKNEGSAPLAPRAEFSSSPTNPGEQKRISGVYLVDPNGRRRFEVLRDAAGVPQCSVLETDLAPGERRELRATFPAPPPTSNTVEIFFPNATQPIVGVPIGLAAAGEPIAENAPVTVPATAPTLNPPAVSASTPPSAARPVSDFKPDVYTNQLPGTAPAIDGPKKATGRIQASNTVVPFTVEVLGLRRTGDGKYDLSLALTNNSSGPLDVGDQFTGGLTDSAGAGRISGVYLVDPATQIRYPVARDNLNRPLCSEIKPPMVPGERRELSARLSGPAPASAAAAPGRLSVYFPEAGPIPDVRVTAAP